MRELGNDRWAGEFTVTGLGVYEYGARGWVDEIGTWRRGLERNADAGNDVSVDILIGAGLVRAAAGRAGRSDAKRLRAWAAELADEATPLVERIARATDDELTDLCRAHADRSHQTVWDPRTASGPSASGRVTRPGTSCSRARPRRARAPRHLRDVDGAPAVRRRDGLRRPLPAAHPPDRPQSPQGRATTRPRAAPGDPGSPWAIGAAGGRPQGDPPATWARSTTFGALVDAPPRRGIEIALDLAFQCSPDHP